MLMINLPKHIFSANPCLLPASSVADGWKSTYRAVHLCVIAYLMLICIKSGIICRLWAGSWSLSEVQQFPHMNQNQQQTHTRFSQSQPWHWPLTSGTDAATFYHQTLKFLSSSKVDSGSVFSHSLTSCWQIFTVRHKNTFKCTHSENYDISNHDNN